MKKCHQRAWLNARSSWQASIFNLNINWIFFCNGSSSTLDRNAGYRWMMNALKLLELLLQSFCISLQLQPVRTAKTTSVIQLPSHIQLPIQIRNARCKAVLNLKYILKLSVNKNIPMAQCTPQILAAIPLVPSLVPFALSAFCFSL